MKEKTIEYKIIRDDTMPPLVITQSGTTGITIVLNESERLWLALHRNTIPAIAQQLQEKLTSFCDGVLSEQLYYKKIGEEDDS